MAVLGLLIAMIGFSLWAIGSMVAALASAVVPIAIAVMAAWLAVILALAILVMAVALAALSGTGAIARMDGWSEGRGMRLRLGSAIRGALIVLISLTAVAWILALRIVFVG